MISSKPGIHYILAERSILKTVEQSRRQMRDYREKRRNGIIIFD